MLLILKYIPGLHLRVQDDIEEIGLDHDQFADELVGEWGLYDTAEGHRRRSIERGALHGVPVTSSESGGTESEHEIPDKKEEHETPA